MINQGTAIQSYASYLNMPLIPYNILSALVTNESTEAEKIWKILKYPDAKAFEKPNLTYTEKMELVWNPTEQLNTMPQDGYRLFLKPLVPASLNTDSSQTQLRISTLDIKSRNQREAVISCCLSITTNETSCMVYDDYFRLLERTDVMVSLLLEVLNGIDLGVGSGRLSFTNIPGGKSYVLSNINNGKSTYGKSLILLLKYYDDSKKGGACF